MKKLLILSLLFSALVFQSCKKISSDIGGGVVPIVFSQAEIATSSAALTKSVPPIKTLVLGTLGKLGEPMTTDAERNDWTTIYSSTSIDDGHKTKYFAIGAIDLYEGADNAVKNGNFDPIVAYPLDNSTEIYIKAFAPLSAIPDGQTLISAIKDGTQTSFPGAVAFQMRNTDNGQVDIKATKPIAKNGASTSTQGIGSGGKPTIDLEFDHLLTRISFLIRAESEAAVRDHWGTFQSITFTGGHLEFTCKLSDNSTVPTDVATSGVFTLTNPDLAIPYPTTAGQAAVPVEACSVMIYPDRAPGTNYKIVIRTKRDDSTIVQSEGITLFTEDALVLTAGGQHDITITFNENKKIGFNVVIAEWGDEVDAPGATI